MPLTRVSFILQVATAVNDPAKSSTHTGSQSEGHWTDAALANIDANAAVLARDRAQFLPGTVKIAGWRKAAYVIAGNKLVPQGANVFKSAIPGNPAYTLNNVVDAMGFGASIQGRTNAVSFKAGLFPDELAANGEVKLDPVSSLQILNWELELQRRPWGTVVQDLSLPSFRVISIANSVVTVLGLAGVAVNDYVVLKRVKDPNGAAISGTYRVSVVAGNALTLAGLDPTRVAENSGFLRKSELVYGKYNEVNLSRTGAKKVGSPFEKFRGRRGKKKK